MYKRFSVEVIQEQKRSHTDTLSRRSKVAVILKISFVNLKYYEKFDKPVWGEAKHKIDKPEHLAAANRHVKDIHDDYTPLALMPTEETKVCTPLVDGWNFINTSLANDLTVYNFHPKIREHKQYIYPTTSAAELEHQLSWITNIVDFARRDGITDALTDLLRTGGPAKFATAVEAELAGYLAQFSDMRT